MAETNLCPHCNGTTYCGARRDPSGKLKWRAACTTCAVKSALDPHKVYTQVVCSVCRGTGKAPEAHAALVKQRDSLLLYAVVIPLVVLSLGLAVIGGIAYERYGTRYQEELERIEQEQVFRPEGALAKDVLTKVKVGMDTAALTDALGAPEAVRTFQGPEGLDLWLYRCRDKKIVWVGVKGGKVISAKSSTAEE